MLKLSIDPALQVTLQEYIARAYPKGMDSVLVGFILVGTVLAAYMFEGLFWRNNPRPERRAGALVGLLCSTLFSAVCLYMSYWSLKGGTIAMACRRCDGPAIYSLELDPISFWFTYGLLTLITILMLSWLVVCVKSLRQWGDLS